MKTLVIGSGVSGRAVYDYLKKKDEDVVFDSELGLNFEENDRQESELNLNKFNQIIISPGIKPAKYKQLQIKKSKIAKKKKVPTLQQAACLSKDNLIYFSLILSNPLIFPFFYDIISVQANSLAVQQCTHIIGTLFAFATVCLEHS